MGAIYQVESPTIKEDLYVGRWHGFQYNTGEEFLLPMNRILLKVKRVVFNNPATIVFWSDGTKTVVKCMDIDDFNPEHGFLQAFYEKMNGDSRTKTNKFLKDLRLQYEEQINQ